MHCSLSSTCGEYNSTYSISRTRRRVSTVVHLQVAAVVAVGVSTTRRFGNMERQERSERDGDPDK